METLAEPVIVAPPAPPMYQICAAPVDGFCQTRSGTPSLLKSAAATTQQEMVTPLPLPAETSAGLAANGAI